MPIPKYKNNIWNTTDMPTSGKETMTAAVHQKQLHPQKTKLHYRYYYTNPNAEHLPKKILFPNTKYTMMIIMLLVMMMTMTMTLVMMMMMMCRAESCCGLISRAAELNLSTVPCSSVNDVHSICSKNIHILFIFLPFSLLYKKYRIFRQNWVLW